MVKLLSTDPRAVAMEKMLEAIGPLSGHEAIETLGNTIGRVLAGLVKAGMYRANAEDLADDVARMAKLSMADNL